MDRRTFIARLIGTGAITWLGCGDPLARSPLDCPEPFADGEYLGTVPFTGGDPIAFHTLRNEGWDGRLYTDLSQVDYNRPLTPNAHFYVRTRFPDLLDLADMTPWTLSIEGMVAEPGDITLDSLLPFVRAMGIHLMECSGNGRRGHFGLMSTAAWAGIPMTRVLDRIQPLPGATRVEIAGFDRHSVPSAGGHSTPGASWIFTRAQLEETGAFLAVEMNAQPLPLDHGFPVRLVVPGWYGCASIKWVDTIRLLDDAAPATSQMQEFARRTHQQGVPALARDYAPADMHQSAMPIRVERWSVGGRERMRVYGILWGGTRTTDRLTIRFRRDDPFEPVEICPPMGNNSTWSIWEHAWDPPAPGDYVIRCAIDDPMISTRRLDVGYYDRFVTVRA